MNFGYPQTDLQLSGTPITVSMAAQLPISRGLVAFRQLPGLLHHLAPSSAFPSRLLPAAVLPATTLFANVSDVISTIWESILRAVPKKRSSYSKKRSRQMAGKGLKDLINLNRCSSCGRTKRMHVLCPYCVQSTFAAIMFYEWC